MTIGSFELLKQCVENGTLSKQAADDVYRIRKELIKEAVDNPLSRLLRMGKRPPPEAKGLARVKQLFSSGGATGVGTKGPAPATPWTDATSNLTKLLMLAGLTAGGAHGIKSIGEHAKKKSQGREIEKSYRGMFKEFPDLREANPNVVRTHFGVLRKYAPSLAADPIVAGSFVRQTSEMGTIHPDQIKMLAATQNEIDKDVREGQGMLGRGAAGIAAKAVGM